MDSFCQNYEVCLYMLMRDKNSCTQEKNDRIQAKNKLDIDFSYDFVSSTLIAKREAQIHDQARETQQEHESYLPQEDDMMFFGF